MSVGALIALCAALPAPAAASPRIRAIVTFTDARRAARTRRSFGLGEGHRVGPRALQIDATAADLAGLRESPGVTAVEPDYPVHADAVPDDPCVTSCLNSFEWQL